MTDTTKEYITKDYREWLHAEDSERDSDDLLYAMDLYENTIQALEGHLRAVLRTTCTDSMKDNCKCPSCSARTFLKEYF